MLKFYKSNNKLNNELQENQINNQTARMMCAIRQNENYMVRRSGLFSGISREE